LDAARAALAADLDTPGALATLDAAATAGQSVADGAAFLGVVL
jgi:hypothetical protein